MRTKIFGSVFGVAVWCLVAACSGKAVYKPLPKVATALQAKKASSLPTLPDKTANNATVAGIDTTGTGVRDDVHIWIYENYTTKIKRTVLMSMAKAIRDVMAPPPASQEEARALQEAEKNASLMLRLMRGVRQPEADEMSALLYMRMLDTPERMKAYLHYNLLQGKDKPAPPEKLPEKPLVDPGKENSQESATPPSP